MKVTVGNEAEMEIYVHNDIVPRLVPNTGKGFLLTLSGDLGAGKTTLTKILAKIFGSTKSVVSPTFILERDYELGLHAPFTTLVHIDAYRFDAPSEATILKLHERLADPKVLAVVEWPEKMGDMLPIPDMKIALEHAGGEARNITVEIQ